MNTVQKIKPYILNIVLIGLILFFMVSILPDILFSTKYTLSWVLIIIGIAIYSFSIIKTNDIFNPVGIFSLVWIVTIGISNFRLSAWQSNWSVKMWFVVTIFYLSFLLGYFLISKLTIHRVYKFIDGEPSENNYKRFIYILFFVCFGAYLAEVMKSGFLPIIASGTGAYKEFGIRFVHYFTVTLVLVNILITLYYFKFKTINKWFIIIYIVSFLSIFTLLSRQLLIFLILITVLSFHYLYRKIKITHLGLILLIGFIAFALLGNLRSNSSSYILEVGRMIEGVESPIFAWLYLYLGYSFENLNYYINNFDQIFWGTNTFFPIFAFTLTKQFIETDMTQFFPYVDLNTSTMAYDFFLDFGVFGVVLFPLLIGGLSAFIYSKVNRSSFYSVIIYTMIAHNLLFVFFVNFFSNTAWFFHMAIIILFIFYTKNNYSSNPLKLIKVRK
jgi:oligosaccharide repeat unit polymerase